MIEGSAYWEPHDRVTWSALSQMSDHPAVLWNTGDSTATGLNDRVSVTEAIEHHASLYLLELDTLVLRVGAQQSASRAKRRVQARFPYRGVHYAMWLTDPVDERRYLAKPDGDYPIGPCCATVSLSEPLDGVCFKLLAAVFPPRPGT